MFPGSLRDTLLRTLEKQLYRGYWSYQIIDEVLGNLRSDSGLTAEDTASLQRALTGAFPDAFVRGYEPLIPDLTCEKKDRHVLAAAIRAGAKRIVTVNLKDFPAAALQPHGITAQHPDSFLLELYRYAPHTVAQVIREQVGDLKNPPRSRDWVLDRLSATVPEFADVLRVALSRRRAPA